MAERVLLKVWSKSEIIVGEKFSIDEDDEAECANRYKSEINTFISCRLFLFTVVIISI